MEMRISQILYLKLTSNKTISHLQYLSEINQNITLNKNPYFGEIQFFNSFHSAYYHSKTGSRHILPPDKRVENMRTTLFMKLRVYNRSPLEIL